MSSQTLTPDTLIPYVSKIMPRLAAFDCDGTIWSGDAGEDFMKWEMTHGVFSAGTNARLLADYARYQQGAIPEAEFWGEMAAVHAGMRNREVHKLAIDFFQQHVKSRVFPAMRRVLDSLLANRTEIWLVSASNQWLIEAAAEDFGVPRDHALAAATQVCEDIVTTEIIRVPSANGKVEALRAATALRPDVAFGNSIFDRELLTYARHAVAVEPSNELLHAARENGWAKFRNHV